MPGMSTIVLLILSIFKVGEMAHLGGKNSLPTVNQPAQIQQNSFLQQTALNSHPPVVSNNNPFGGDAIIGHNNHFVPIEKEFVACQSLANAAGYQCEFSLDEMMLESNKTNVEIWANFGEENDGTLRLLGQQDASKCNADEDGQAQCDTKLVINSDQIDQLKSISMDEVNDAILQSNKDAEVHRRQLGEGAVTFWLYNKCGKDLMVGGNVQGTVVNNVTCMAKIPAAITSARFWFNKDCNNDEVKHYCDVQAAQPPTSLFEMTFKNGQSLEEKVQFYDVSLVDGFNVPISVFVKDCPGVNISKNYNFNSLLNALPAEMKDLTYNSGQDLVGVKSVCGAFDTDAVCCRNAYNLPGTCKPDTDHGWEQKQIDAYNVMRAAFPDAYNYAYDDQSATKVCKGATDFHIGICTQMTP
uniref:Uncharacterized protein n=1 Tax=Globodera rostochiensis TaxID=31243 RepID=A0A914I1B3_GLORO